MVKCLKKVFLIIFILILIPTSYYQKPVGCVRPGHSTINQLLFLVDEIHQAFEDRNSLEIRAVFLDISKAFDNVRHEVPQGSVLGPLLFLIYINIKSNINFFADDTMLFSVVK